MQILDILFTQHFIKEILRESTDNCKTDSGANVTRAGRAALGFGREKEKSFRAFSIGEL